MRRERYCDGSRSDLRKAMREKIFMVQKLRFVTLALLVCCVALKARTTAQGLVDAGTISGDTYHNSELGFRYQFPDDWVANETDTEKEIEDGHQVAWEDTASKKLREAPSRCTKNLLFATQHPAGMPTNGFDPSVLLMSIDPACVPGAIFPSSVKDQDGIQRSAKQIMSHLKMATVISRSPVQLRAFDIAGRVMIEISESFNISIHEPARTTTQNIHTSILLMQAGGHWILWRFAADTDYNLNRLRATKIFFDADPERDKVK
jgi:hypothetical protein